MEVFSNAGHTCASFPPNPFAATVYIQTRDCGTACENSYCLCNNHTEKKRGEGSFKRFFSHREERIFLVPEKEKELSPQQLKSVQVQLLRVGWWGWWCAFLNSHSHGGFSWIQTNVLRFSWNSWIFHLWKEGQAENMARKKPNSLFFLLGRRNWPHVPRNWGQLHTISAIPNRKNNFYYL